MLVGVIGMGYVGRSIAHALMKAHDVVCVDINESLIEELNTNTDMHVTNDYHSVKDCDVVLVCVQTPLDEYMYPDISCLKKCIEGLCAIGYNNIVCIESTVEPNTYIRIKRMFMDANLYPAIVSSPERINPHFNTNGLYDDDMYKSSKIVGSDDEDALNIVKKMYEDVGFKTHIVHNNKVAEYAKLFENIQRDVNIAYMNTFARICKEDGVSFRDVFEASKTKYNFCDFYPGIVGGHCIGVDIGYLLWHIQNFSESYKNIIQIARNSNNNIVDNICEELEDIISKNHIKNLIIYGISYKKNIDDTRESGTLKIYKRLRKNSNIDDIEVYDSLCKPNKNIEDIHDDTLVVVGHLHNVAGKNMAAELSDLLKKNDKRKNVIVYNTTFDDTIKDAITTQTYISTW